MELSKTKIKNRASRKTNPALKNIIALATKNKSWNPLAKKLSGSTQAHTSINLDELDEKLKDGDKAIIAGKVLSKGELTKKVTLSALAYSEAAKEKLDKAKIPLNDLEDEINKNKEAKGVIFL
jgi:large subunit ribosomal protein L18e